MTASMTPAPIHVPRVALWRSAVSTDLSPIPADSPPDLPTYSERIRLSCDALDRLSWWCARKVASRFSRITLSYGKQESEAVDAMHSARSRAKRLRKGSEARANALADVSHHSAQIRPASFSRAFVSPDTLSDMQSAARAAFLASPELSKALQIGMVNELIEAKRLPYDVVKSAFNSARKCLVRENELSFDAMRSVYGDSVEPVAPYIPQNDSELLRDIRDKLTTLRPMLCKVRAELRAYWIGSNSRKWRAGLNADYATLRDARRVALGLSFGSLGESRNAVSMRVLRMRERAKLGEALRAMTAL